jgi:hypothetical protein
MPDSPLSPEEKARLRKLLSDDLTDAYGPTTPNDADRVLLIKLAASDRSRDQEGRGIWTLKLWPSFPT